VGRCRREEELSFAGFQWTVKKETENAKSHGSNALTDISGTPRKYAFESREDYGPV
jgi:hypothetical protein